MRRNSILIPLSFLRILFFRSDAPAARQSQLCYCSKWSEFRTSPFRDRDDPSLSLRFTSLAPASLLCPDHTLVPRIDKAIESCSQKMDRISHLWGQKDEPCYHCIYIFPPRVLFGTVYARRAPGHPRKYLDHFPIRAFLSSRSSLSPFSLSFPIAFWHFSWSFRRFWNS